jgi:hypothetical protein
VSDSTQRTSNILVDLARYFAIGKSAQGRLPQRHAEILRDFAAKCRIRIAAEEFEIVHGVVRAEK